MTDSYYLEANALIAISSEELLRLKNKNIYTSSVAVLEFIKGLSCDNYAKRKLKLDVVYNHLYIDWAAASQKMEKIFGDDIVRAAKQNKCSLEHYVKLLLKSNHYAEFLSTIENSDLLYKKLDECLLKHAVPMSEILSTEYMNKLLKSSDMTDSKSNIFINACKFYRHNYFNKTADKNDMVDLIHTLYIKDLKTGIVTNDKKLSKICRRGAKINTLNVSEFRLLIKSI